jgi:hypothetical protein
VSFAAITLCIASQRVFVIIVVYLFRYRLRPETFGYTLVRLKLILIQVSETSNNFFCCYRMAVEIPVYV